MRILIGAPVWLGNRPFRRTLSSLSDYDYIEFSLDFPLPECMRASERDEFMRYLDDLGMNIAFHSPLDVHAVHPRAEIFEASMRVLRKCFEFASRLSSPLYYNLHLHPRITTLKLDEIRKHVEEICIDQCERIAEMGEEFGLTLTVENDFMPFEWSDLIFRAISATEMRFTLDIGHAIMSEMHQRRREARKRCGDGGDDADFEEHVARRDAIVQLQQQITEHAIEILNRWVERCAERMLVVHIHDCALIGCEMSDHISLGRGDLNIEEVFRTVRRADFRYMLIEAFWRNRHKEDMTYEEMRRNLEICGRFL